MRNFSFLKVTKIAIQSAVLIFLSSCGGGGGGSDNGTPAPIITPTPIAAKKGQFIDSQVAGLDFQTARRSGTTDSNGTFDYDSDGEIITFSIGATVLGTARANSIVHVFDVAGQSQITDNSRGERLAQLLQTLDEDGNTANGIQLSPATKAALLAQPAIDFAVTDAAWNTRITAVASSTFKTVVPMAQAVSHAQANQPASNTCAVADATYPLADVDNLGKFSTAGRTCDKKARSMAFYEDVYATMLSAAGEYRNSPYIADGEAIAQKDVETLAKNNLVNNSLNLALDHIKFLEVDGKTSAETFAKVLSNSAKLTKDIVTWSTSLACNIQGTCANPQEFAVKMTAKVADVISKTSACFTGKADKCADAIKTSADINDLLKLSYGDVSAETVSKLADFAAAWVGTLADGWDAVNDGNLSDWTAFAGSLADTVIKTKTNYYTRSDNETAHRSASVNALEIVGEGVKAFAACYLPKTPIPTEVVKHYSKCAGEMFTYVNQRSAEIGSYFFMILTVQDLLRRADDMDVARTVLSEWHHYDGMTRMFAHYGIAKPASDAEVRRSLEKLLPVIATKIGLSSARYAVGGTLDSQRVIDTIFLYFNSVTIKSKAILAGKFTSCRSIELGEIDSPQFIRDARYPYLIAVQTNTPINFAASYTPSPAIVGYDFNFGNGTSVTSDLPAANYTYAQTNGYNLSVTPIIKSVSGGIRTCESKRRVVAFRAKDLTPKVTDVQPKTATIGISTTFTVTGSNLPAKAVMSIADAVCVNPPTFKAAGFTIACTLGGAIGTKVVTVKTDTAANGGTLILDTYSVSATAPNSSVASTITIPAATFVRGVSVALSTNGYGSDTLMNAPPYGAADNAAEWDFSVPVTAQYQLSARYASGSSRPVTLSIDGQVLFTNALAENTGGFFPSNRKILPQGVVYLNAGLHTLRTAETGANVFPHISEFQLIPITQTLAITGNFSVPANSPSGYTFVTPVGTSSCTYTTAPSVWTFSSASFQYQSAPDGIADYIQGYASSRIFSGAAWFSLIAFSDPTFFPISYGARISSIGGKEFRFQINEISSTVSDVYANNSGSMTVDYSCQ